MTKRIYAVDKVDLALQKSMPPNLLIDVEGRTSTSGWSNISLVPFVYIEPPADGVQDYDVVGSPPPPDVFVMQVLTKIRTHSVIPAIDIANYWGPKMPLLGVRCYAQSNSKVQLFEPSAGMTPVTEITNPDTKDAVEISFERDIRPLFRPADISVMIAIRNLDLSSFDDASTHADLIIERLADGSMPCDGAWPDTDIDLFRRWIAQGKNP